MLGSRFDLAATLSRIARREEEQAPAAAAEIGLGDHCAELEQQMAAVARHLHSVNPRTSFRCPICDTRMQLNAGRVMVEFAALGVERHDLECDTCGLTTMRAYHASQGYRDILR